ncbi:MAG: chromosomal replication initiator protein DnaA [Actinobacteria bacterium]|nr:chromosomal replication initiator protein DnaA [Actinomycetota bacterium]
MVTFTPPAPTVGRGQSLDPRMTFEAFVTGGSNRMAKAAAESAAERPGREYNPLFIYGKSGLGKTHLLHAIGNYVHRHWPEKEVLYVTTETFLNDFIRSVREQSQIALHERYRSVDVLLIDDIQFMIPRGEGFHENVFHTFNTLHGAGKQIVLTSDQSPRDMDKLQERLRSRLLQGLIVEVGQPDLETRIAILQMKAERENVVIPNDVIEYIANRVRDSIRELEGSITMLRAHSQLAEEKITLEFAKSHLGGLGRDQMILKPQHVIDTVAIHFGYTPTELRGPRRIRPLTRARHIAMYLVREMLPQSSYPVIAKEFGDRNHTSVISAVEKIKGEMVSDRELSQVIIGLTNEITNSID